MPSGTLRGVGVLVTRAQKQSRPLIEAIEAEGGRAVCFPVLEIEPREEEFVASSAAVLPESDIVVFASPNAVEYGQQYAAEAKIAAIGPATAAAIRANGRVVDISPAGYDSESLIDEPMLQNVSGKKVLIIRGNDGRELLAESLRQRGATVNYLSVYDRRLSKKDSTELFDIESKWRNREVDAVTVMSVQSLKNLIASLPKYCVEQLSNTPLVTPAVRVIKEVLDRYPSAMPILAAGPTADAIIQAVIDNRPCKSRD